MAKREKIPKWLLKNCGVETRRQFKQLKRKQLRNVLKAWNDYNRGCAYCRNYPNGINVIDLNLLEIKEDLSIKNWGR